MKNKTMTPVDFGKIPIPVDGLYFIGRIYRNATSNSDTVSNSAYLTGFGFYQGKSEQGGVFSGSSENWIETPLKSGPNAGEIVVY